MVKHHKADKAVNYIMGPSVSFKPSKKSIVPGETIGYESNVPAPGTIGKDVQRKPGFKQIALFKINADKNRPKKPLIVKSGKSLAETAVDKLLL